MVAGYCGGSEACVRQVVGAVRGLFCFEYRCGHSARLLPQETSAGAKPNHAFSKCQHFLKNIFRPVRALAAPRTAGVYTKNSPPGPRQRRRCGGTLKKHRVSCSFVTHCSQSTTVDRFACVATQWAPRQFRTSERARNCRWRRRRNLAMHQTKCADLRKLFLPFGSSRARFWKLSAVAASMVGLANDRPLPTTRDQ